MPTSVSLRGGRRASLRHRLALVATTVSWADASRSYAAVIDELSKQAAAVDPVEPAKVIEAAAREGVIVCSVLTTHSHWDHSGGNEEFSKLVPDAVIYGGKRECDCTAGRAVSGTVAAVLAATLSIPAGDAR